MYILLLFCFLTYITTNTVSSSSRTNTPCHLFWSHGRIKVRIHQRITMCSLSIFCLLWHDHRLHTRQHRDAKKQLILANIYILLPCHHSDDHHYILHQYHHYSYKITYRHARTHIPALALLFS